MVWLKIGRCGRTILINLSAMKMTIRLFLIVTVLGGLILTACSSADDQTSSSDEEAAPSINFEFDDEGEN